MGWDILKGFFDFSDYESPKTKLSMFIIFLIVIILLIVFIATLLKLKRMRKTKGTEQNKEGALMRTGKNPRKELLLLDKRVRGFFEEYLGSESRMTYGEMEKRLMEKKKLFWAGFCQRMNYYLYSGRDIKREDIINLKRQFADMLAGKNLRKARKPKKAKKEKKLAKKAIKKIVKKRK